MKIEQFVMAYGVDHDRLRALLPEGFTSLRPVLRINAEIRDGASAYIEYNTAVAHGGKRGWLNIGHWENAAFRREGDTVIFHTPLLTLSHADTGLVGGCPAEKDNDGCFFGLDFRPAEQITVNKTFSHCRFHWQLPGGTQGESIGKTLPAIPTEAQYQYPRQACTVENAAAIPCQQVLGAYRVAFVRRTDLENAKTQLLTDTYTCVLCKGGTVLTSQARGVKPLVCWYAEGQALTGFSGADKVVGKATAYLYALLGVRALYAGVISRSALAVLQAHGIHAEYGKLVENITNRRGDGICPFEEAVLDIHDPQAAYAAIRAKMAAMNITI